MRVQSTPPPSPLMAPTLSLAHRTILCGCGMRRLGPRPWHKIFAHIRAVPSPLLLITPVSLQMMNLHDCPLWVMLATLGPLIQNPGFVLYMADFGSCGCQRWFIHTASLKYPAKGLPSSTSEIATSAVIGLAVTHPPRHSSLFMSCVSIIAFIPNMQIVSYKRSIFWTQECLLVFT